MSFICKLPPDAMLTRASCLLPAFSKTFVVVPVPCRRRKGTIIYVLRFSLGLLGCVRTPNIHSPCRCSWLISYLSFLLFLMSPRETEWLLSLLCYSFTCTLQSCGSYMFSFLSNCQTGFQRVYTMFHAHQWSILLSFYSSGGGNPGETVYRSGVLLQVCLLTNCKEFLNATSFSNSSFPHLHSGHGEKYCHLIFDNTMRWCI